MKASLVIPTWNGAAELEVTLAAVARQPGAAALERVAVDSSSTDGTRETLARHGFAVHRIAQRDFDHGATRDYAIERTTGDVILLLTQDAVPADERWLAELLAPFADPEVGAAYCRQIPRDDCNPFLRRRLLEWAAGRTEPVLQRATRAEYDALPPLQRLQLCAYDNVAGAVRRATWERLRFGRRRFGEDVAFGKRVILAGQAIAYRPSSAVVHSHNRSPREEGKRIYCDHQNLSELFELRLIPARDALLAAIEWGRREYARVVDELELPPPERAELHRWARDYARWAATGMFLGAASATNLAGPRAAHYARIDRWMHAGI
jgi:rhamnosyltransferase